MSSSAKILLTGATGYVGGRLMREFERQGRPIRCMARRPQYLTAEAGPLTEVVAGDIFDRDSLRRSLFGIATAYYLVHSMGDDSGFEEQDRRGAENFGAAARACGVRRIVYLGGLGDSQGDLSPHLRSRHEVGEVLAGQRRANN